MKDLEFDHSRKEVISLNMTPLIDMVFLLLIFFILSSHFVLHRGIPVNLPESTNAVQPKRHKAVLSIHSSGEVYLNDSKISLGQLPEALRKHMTLSGEREVVVKADQGVLLGLAVGVMDAAKQAGARNLVIATDPKNEKT